MFGFGKPDFALRAYQEIAMSGNELYMTTYDGTTRHQINTDWAHNTWKTIDINVEKRARISWFENEVERANSPSTADIPRVLVRKYATPEPTTTVGAERTPTVKIASGALIVNKNANETLNVTYSNFTGGDSSNITVFKDMNENGVLDISGDAPVYFQNDTLDGSPVQVVKVYWTPLSAGLHWVAANGVHSTVIISDTVPVYPVPELVTAALVAAGMIGLMAMCKRNRR